MSFDRQPDDIIWYICKYLTNKDIATLKCVSNTFHKVNKYINYIVIDKKTNDDAIIIPKNYYSMYAPLHYWFWTRNYAYKLSD